MVSSIVSILLIAWILLAVLVYVFQPHLIYFPSSKLESNPSRIGLRYESVHLTAADGPRLHGWYIPASKPRAVVLFFHGNAGNISHRLESVRIFNKLELTTFIFDYRGYGLSAGGPSEQGTYLDAQAAWRFLTDERGIPADRILLFGRSLGAAIATWLATQHKPAGLILESSFTSVRDLARRYYPYLPTRLLVRVKYPTLDRISHVACPILVIHSPEDEIIPFIHGKRLFEAASGVKKFVSISGGHNDGFWISGDRYVAALDEFVTGVMTKKPQ